jgi:transcriptional regulator with GAF, ATPase, and Fis domain
MERHAGLLLDVWREVCRHIEIGESIERLGPILMRRLPIDVIIIRRLDPARSCVDTVAIGYGKPASAETSIHRAGRTNVTAAELEQLAVWCARGRMLRGSARVARRRLPGVLPEGLEGQVLAGPLLISDAPAGVLILMEPSGTQPRDEYTDLVQQLLEPFAVALENDQRLRELVSLREALEADKVSLLSRLGRHDISDSIVGAETGLKPVMDQIELVARSDTPVLILGETGAGKEVVARAIHGRSRRSQGPFLRVNCGAIPPELVDSELFGHERGSFTGAVGTRKGWFERADGGTLFLDECGELTPAAQVRLLRILQDGTFERVGGERQLHVDVRVVAATHRDMAAMIGDGRFRQDLWYRLAIFPIRLPPLRDRPADIPALAAHFALRATTRLGLPPMTPTAGDINLLVGYPWPGNVRELAAVIERAAILGAGDRLDVARALGHRSQGLMTSPPGAGDAEFPPKDTGPLDSLDAAMARHIEHALSRTGGRIEGPSGAAALLEINPHTLRARMRKLGVQWKNFRRTVPARRAWDSKPTKTNTRL